MLRAKKSRGAGFRRQKGFTLFEMVVAISSIVILYMVAEQRLNDLPAAAERASFLGILEQIKTGVHVEMITRMTKGARGSLRSMENQNPMNYLLEKPSNYLGEYELVTDELRRRNAWYFERSTGELVYLVGGSNIDNVWVRVASVPVHLGQIRFKLQIELSGKPDNNAGSAQTSSFSVTDEKESEGRLSQSKIQGVLLKPVFEYSWESRYDLVKDFLENPPQSEIEIQGGDMEAILEESAELP